MSLVEDLRRLAMRNFDELQDILLRRQAALKTMSTTSLPPSSGTDSSKSSQLSSGAEAKAMARNAADASTPAEDRGKGMASAMGIGIKQCYKEIVQVCACAHVCG